MANQRDWRNAATFPTGDGAPDDPSWAFGAVTAPTTDIIRGPNTAPPPPAPAPRQIVFIEGNVADTQLLADGVQPDTQAVILDPNQDGVQQIADYLQQHQVQNLAAISIVSDGTEGELQLGTTLLSASNVASFQPQLAEIGAALKPGGDLLIYGCDVAQNSAGVAFLGDLATATGVANIAAASHVVGAAAQGGSFNLDVDLGTAATAPGPFTPATIAAYPDLLGVTSTVAWYISDLGAAGGTGVYNVDVNGGTSETSQTDVQSTPGYAFGQIEGVAIDSPYGHYFVSSFFVNGSSNDVNQIIEGNTSGSGTPSVIYTSGNSGQDAIVGVALNPQNGLLYFAVTDANVGTSDTDTGIYTINARGSGTQTATDLVNLSSGTQAPNDIAIDTTHNLLFYTNGVPGLTSVEEVGVANLTTGAVINGDLVSYSASGVEPYGIAVNPATDTLYWTTVNFSANSGNTIYSATYSTGASVTLSNTQTLATTNDNELPIGIDLDTPAGGYYVVTESSSNSAQGQILFGSSLTSPASLASVFTVPQVNGEDVEPQAIVVETQPAVTASGTATFDDGGSAVAVDSGATVPADADGNDLASATVSIASGMGSGDALNFINQNGITGSYSSGTLTLTGVATEANYQTALDGVTFSTTSTNATARTLDWTVNDGYVSSPSTTSTVDVHVAPIVTAGTTVTFDGGGSPVTLDSGLTVTDASSPTLASATITIGGFISGDTFSVGTLGSLGSSFSNGTLTLNGVANVSVYQTALDSIAYSFSPSNGDPTGGGTHTSRTIDWSVYDGVLNSSTATSTLDIVHEPPTITTGGTVTFTGGGDTPVTLDVGVVVTDPDSSGDISSATVTIGGFITGDTLTVGTPGGLATSFNNSGTLTLSGIASIGTYETVLQSIDYRFNPTNGDPTDDGSHNSRTIDWVVSDGSTSNGISNTGTSTLDEVHVAPTVTTSGTVTYPEGGTAVVLDSGVAVVDQDSSGTLAGATVTISGALSTDLLSFTPGNGISGSYNVPSGKLTLSGSSSILNYEAALSSVTYSNSGDPTNGGADANRTVSWVVNDGAASSAASDSSLTTLCFCAGTRIGTPRGEMAVQHLAVGDSMLTASGATRKIVWIGMGRVLVTSGHRSAATPVIVRKGALASNVPHHDLRVSKGHALYVDNVLIPVEFLVNHRSILWDDRAREVALYHVELDSHDVLLANGAPAESYRDDGNRWLFHNANSGWGLPPQEPCRPVLTGGPIVDAAWRRLLDRAGPRPGLPLTEDADLHLLVDGRRIDAASRHGEAHVFCLAARPRTVRVASRAAAPQELGVARDPRVLGVALRRIMLRQGARLRLIEAADASLADGFHGYEPDNLFRWTDGDGLLPAALFGSVQGGFELELHVACCTRYIVDAPACAVA